MTRQPPSITPYPDGPLIVRGDVQLIDAAGNEVERSRRTVALCRCGLSNIKPFCDGTHKAAGFRTDDDPSPRRADGRLSSPSSGAQGSEKLSTSPTKEAACHADAARAV